MSRTLRSARPFYALFTSLAANAPDKTALQQAAQLALQVEFATIPVYLTGLYSIADVSSPAYQLLRSVVMEEMFHVNQAANLVVALGALPQLTGAAVPVYPGYLPHANPNTTPLLGLYRASQEVFQNVFAAIENPAPAGAPPQPDHYDGIAQLYEALSAAIVSYPGDPFDSPAPNGRQRTDIYLGKFGGTVLEVNNRETALKGITQIVRQGEGSVPPGQPLVPTEPYGAYNHYGKRTDGTYGPILGTPLELSHFVKFRHVAQADGFPSTLPITSNPREDQFTNPRAVGLSQAFNTAYSLMLQAFERTFQRGQDPYFGQVLTLMHQVLPQLALALMNTPAQQEGNASVGPNAAPTWLYREDASLSSLEQQLAALQAALGGDTTSPTAQALAQAEQGLSRIISTSEEATP